MRARTDLSRLFDPSSIAIIGASPKVASIGNRVLVLLGQHGYPGMVYPVNPRYDEIDGLPCVPDLRAISTPVDLAIVAVRQDSVIDVVRDCADSAVGACIIMSSGFGEGGAGVTELEQLREVLRKSDMRICGPNSLGVFCPPRHLAATFSAAADIRKDLQEITPGSIAVLSQSGALGFSVMATLAWSGVGIGAVASPGNSLDIDVADLMEYWLAQPEIGFIAGIVEEIKDAARMHELGAAVRESGKPVAMLKLGRSDVGQRASLSHTGAMSGSADVYSGFFNEYGIVEVDDVPDLIALGRLFGRASTRYGPRVAILTPSGGSGILISDLLTRHGLVLPPTSNELADRLRAVLPPYASVINPIDVTAQATANADESGQVHAQEAALIRVLESAEYDVVISLLPVTERTVARLAEIARIAEGQTTPVLVYSDRPINDTARVALGASKLPWFIDANQMSSALGAAARWCTRHAEAAGDDSAMGVRVAPPGPADCRAPDLHGEHDTARFDQVHASLDRHGLGAIRQQVVTDPDSAADAAVEIGFPVAVKIYARAAAHKTELNGVRLAITGAEQVRAAAQGIQEAAAESGLPGVSLVVQQMVSGVEALISFRRDPKFGPVVVLGCGGIHTELLKQFSVRLAPVSEAEAGRMIEEVEMLRAQLRGVRGRPEADVHALVEYVARFSQLAILEWDGIDEVEVNPLIIGAVGAGVVGVDLVVS